MRKRKWLILALLVVGLACAYVSWRVLTAGSLGEHYQTVLITKTRAEVDEIIGAPANRYWQSAEIVNAGGFLNPDVGAVGHWYTSKGTVSIAFDKSGKAINVEFAPSMRREGSQIDQFFYLIGW